MCLYKLCKSIMLVCCPWRGSDCAEPTSARRNTSGSGKSRADAFLITAPLSHTPKNALWSRNKSCSFVPPKEWLTYEREWLVYLIRNVIMKHFLKKNYNLPAVIPHFGDQSMAATWSKELQVSRMAGPCRSSTLWRATWGRDDERPRLSWTRTKPSAPSQRFQGWLTLSKSLNTCHWRWEHTYNSRVCFDPFV